MFYYDFVLIAREPGAHAFDGCEGHEGRRERQQRVEEAAMHECLEQSAQN